MKTLRLFCSLLLFSLVTLIAKSQNFCGLNATFLELNSDPQYLAQKSALGTSFQIWKNQGGGNTEQYIIPVVVHIIHNNGLENISDEQVANAIQNLNIWYGDGIQSEVLDFPNPHMKFELARIDPLGECTTGIVRHQTTTPIAAMQNLDCSNDPFSYTAPELASTFGSWDPLSYMNIFVVLDITCPSTGVSGFATRPTIGDNNVVNHMVVIKHEVFGYNGTATANNQYVLEHEVGHYFGLLHTLDSQCNLNTQGEQNCACSFNLESDCSTGGDLCCDTDPWPCCLLNSVPYNCDGIFPPGFCVDGDGDVVDLEDEHRNFMQSPTTECELVVQFTEDQVLLMHYFLENEPRSLLWQNQNLINTGVIWEEPVISNMTFFQECGVPNSVTVIPSYANPELNENWTYEWLDFEGEFISDTPILESGTPGNITLVVSDESGCGVSETIFVPQPTCCTNSPNERVFSSDVIIDQQNWNIISSELQGFNTYFQGDLSIQSGTAYLGSGMLAFFEEESDVLVQENASLQLSSSTLQACSTRWKGIDVFSEDLTPGALILSNCNLKYAEIGIETRDETPEDGPVAGPGEDGIWNNWDDEPVFLPLNYNAGQIKCTNSKFINNKRSVHVVDAIAENTQSYFLNCEFTVDDDLYNHFTYTALPECSNDACPIFGDPNEYFNFVSHIRYDRVIGYPFRGCQFRNDMINPTYYPCGWEERGAAIRSVDALYHIQDNDLGEHSEFSGFFTGIHSFNISGFWNGLTINEAHFHHNKIAMYFHDICFHDVIACNIDIGDPFVPAQPLLDELEEDSFFEGICQLKGAFFIFTENDLDGGNTESGTIGCRIRSTKAPDNSFVHRNWFDNLDYANKADGQNIEGTENSGAYSGLRYTCQFNGEDLANGYDFEVNEFTNDLLTDISALQQGMEWNPLDEPVEGTNDDLQAASPGAGSTFSDSNDPLHISDFWNNGDHSVTYKYFGTDQIPNWGTDVNGNGLIDEVISTTLNVSPNLCVEIVELLPDGDGFIQQYQLDKWDNWVNWTKPLILANMYLQEALIDGGNTNEVIDDIDWGTNTTFERDKLLAQSPHLSTDVLRAVADNTTLFPHPVALEIFVGNPDVLRDNRFINYLRDKTDPMPEYMIDILLASRNQETMRSMLMKQRALLTSIHGRSTAILGRTILRNINADKSPIIFMADEMDCLVCEFRLIDEMINDGNTTQALDRFNSIQSRIQLNDESSRMEYDAYELYLNLRNDMIVSGTNWQTITSDQLNTLCDVSAAFTTWAGVQAVGILNAHFTKNHIIPPAFKNEWNIRSFQLLNSSSQSPVITYPNPADESINLEITAPFNEASFVIYDSMNRLIYQGTANSPNSPVCINSRNWESGIYYYLFTIDHQHLSGKFEIIH